MRQRGCIHRIVIPACAALGIMLVGTSSSVADAELPPENAQTESRAVSLTEKCEKDDKPQVAKLPSAWNAILDRLDIQQTLDDSIVPKPALAQFVRSEGKNTWSLHAGAKITLPFGGLSEYVEIGPTFEIHRDTTTEQKQDFSRAGIEVETASSFPTTWVPRPHVVAAIGHVRDGVKDTRGFTAKTKLSLMVRAHEEPWHNLYRPNRYAMFRDIHVTYTPFIGFEYENILNAMTAGDEGDIGRIHAQFTLILYPKPDRLQRRLELIVDGSWRTDVFGSLQGGDRHHPFVSTSLNVYLLKQKKENRALGLGIDYVWGENPDEKFEKQALVRFGVKGML